MKKWVFCFLTAILIWVPGLSAQSDPLQVTVSQGTLALFPKTKEILDELNKLKPLTFRLELSQESVTAKLADRLISEKGVRAVIFTTEEAQYLSPLLDNQLEKRELTPFDVDFLPLIIGPQTVTYFTDLKDTSVYMREKPVANFFWNNFVKECIVPKTAGPDWLRKESTVPQTLVTNFKAIGFLMSFARLQGLDPELPPDWVLLSELEQKSGRNAHAALFMESTHPNFTGCQEKRISSRGFEWTIRAMSCDASHSDILKKILRNNTAEEICKAADPKQAMATMETRLYFVYRKDRKDVREAVGKFNEALVERAANLRLNAKMTGDYSDFRKYVTNVAPFVTSIIFVEIANTLYRSVKSSWFDFDDEWQQEGKTGREFAKYRIAEDKKPLEDDHAKALMAVLDKETEYQEFRRKIDSYDVNLLSSYYRVGVWHYWLWKHYRLRYAESRDAADDEAAAKERDKAKNLFARLKTGIDTMNGADPTVNPEYEEAKNGPYFVKINKRYNGFVVKLLDEIDNA